MASVTAVVWVPFLAQELLHAADVAKTGKKVQLEAGPTPLVSRMILGCSKALLPYSSAILCVLKFLQLESLIAWAKDVCSVANLCREAG